MKELLELVKILKGKVVNQNYYAANLNERSFKKIMLRDYKGYSIGVDIFQDLLMYSVKINWDWAFAINGPDKIFNFNTRLSLDGFDFDFYIEEHFEHKISELVEVNQNNLFNRIAEFKLDAKEGVFFYRNCLLFVFSSDRDIQETLDRITDCLEFNDDLFWTKNRARIFKKNLPDSLQILVPMLKKYYKPDDQERSEMINTMTPQQKQKLIEKIEPYFDSINDFMNSFGENPLSEEAISLGNLAELGSELKNQ